MEGAEKAIAMFLDDEHMAEVTKKMSVHKMSPAHDGKSKCRRCGWVANANDEGWNLDRIPKCLP